METSGVVYEVECDNCFRNYTGETGRKLKGRMKGHEDDGEKSRKDKKSLAIALPAWDDVRIIEKITGKRESSKRQLE